MSLSAWLDHLEQLHPVAIDLGLDRCRAVAERLELVNNSAKTVTVAGTNGKGTTVAVLEALLMERGATCGAFTSPHFIRYNERIKINGHEVSDDRLVTAFEAIEAGRGAISLTYFEFGALAALWLFKEARVAYQLLEVGLGGRLDAVNIIDSDVAVITSIGLDHQEWLGSCVDTIAVEKCGIARRGAPCIVADRNAPVTVVPEIERVGARPVRAGVDFECNDRSFLSASGSMFRWQLPEGLLSLNVGAAVAALIEMGLTIDGNQLSRALNTLTLRGRRELRQHQGITLVLDVAHNVDAVAQLRHFLSASTGVEKTVAIFAVMSDKAYRDMILLLEDHVDFWCLPRGVGEPRAQDPEVLACSIRGEREVFSSFSDAFDAGMQRLGGAGRLLIFGSFVTVGKGMTAWERYDAQQGERVL